MGDRIFIFFLFVRLPFLFSSLGQSVTIQLIDNPSPLIPSALISHAHPLRKHLRSNPPLQRGPGTTASTNKYPKSLRLQQIDGVRATQILSAGEALQEMTYLLLGYLHISRWEHHSYLSSVAAVLGIPHSLAWLSAAPVPSASCCCFSPRSRFSARSSEEINNSNRTPD